MPDRTDRGVKVTMAAGEPRPMSPRTRWFIIALGWVLASAGVLLGSRVVADAQSHDAESAPPPAAALDANASNAPTADKRVAGSTRLVAMPPEVLLDSRRFGAFPAGVNLTVAMPELPAGTRDVLVEMSILNAKGPGEVTLGWDGAASTVLKVAKSKAQQSATVVAHLDDDGQLRAGITGGGHLLVRLVGAFEPAERSAAGRFVAIPPTRVVRLVPRISGKKVRFAIANVPRLAEAGPISAVLLQVSADVGPKGGSISAGTSAKKLDQTVFWSATSGSDRIRNGLMFVPVDAAGTVHLLYQAGTEMRADVVGYVTGAGAPEAIEGLVIPVPPHKPDAVRMTAGSSLDVSLDGAAELAKVAPERIRAALVTVTATGESTGGVTVYAADAAPPKQPTLIAPKGGPRTATVLVQTQNGLVRVDSAVDATVTVTPRALVLGG